MDHRPTREVGREAYHNQLIFTTEQAKTAVITLANGLVMAMAPYLDDLPLDQAQAVIEQVREQLQGEADYLLDRQDYIARERQEQQDRQ